MKHKEYKVTLLLTVEQVNQLSGLTRLYNDHLVSEGCCPNYTEHSYLQLLLSFRLAELLSDELDYYKRKSGLAGDVPTRNPFPEAAPDEEPETLVAVRDASGVVREVTLDEAEEMREAAQGIYEGQSPEPTEEPETLVPVINAFGCRRMVTPDKLKTMSDAADVYHIVDWDGVILETVETNLYTEALEWRDITAERLGVDSEKLDVMTAEEYENEWGDGEEEEPETVSNVRSGPLIENKSDFYFRYLEGGAWPDTPCTGDYGLSDCLAEPSEETLDFVDAFFVHS